MKKTFKKGDRVKVTRKGLKTTGLTGTVHAISYRQSGTVTVDVRIPLWGILSYNSRSLKLEGNNTNNIETNKGENDMLMGNYGICKVKFIEGANTSKEYYYALYDNNITFDDYVVVKSANHGFGIARVTEIVANEQITQSMRDYCNEGREVVSTFDMSAYEQRVEKRKQAKQLKSEMNRKMKEVQELAMFEMMAEKNPELKEMLDSYKALIGDISYE